MPALILLATFDDRLAAVWERQIPAGWPHARLGSERWPAGLAAGTSGVLVLDAAAAGRISPALLRLPTIWVGDAAAAPAGAKALLSPEATHHGLCQVIRLLDEIADQQAVVAMLAERCRRTGGALPAPPPASNSLEAAAVWDLFESAWEQLDDREQLLAEFRRGARHLLQSGETQFFMSDGARFRSDRGSAVVRGDDPFVRYLELRPYPIEADHWESGADPIEEASVRTRLAQWGAKIAAPIFDGARLLGWIALGPRRDGRPYGDADRLRVALLARLLGRGLRSRAPRSPGPRDDRAVLQEIGLTLAHELGNALVPLSTLRQWEGETLPEPLLAAARREIAELEKLQREVGRLQELDRYPFETIDLREIVADAARELGLTAAPGDPIKVTVAIPLLRYALRTLAGAATARGTLEARAVDTAGGRIAQVTVRGENLHFTGLAANEERPGVPNQGRLAVFLAKEIIRLHRGEIRLGPGPAGSELVIEVRSEG